MVGSRGLSRGYGFYLCFFFSSRRRHTRLQGDWSSDVCSSDLPAVVVHAHTASSYANGFANEPALVERLASLAGVPAVTAAGAVRAALQHLGVKRVALGTPYQESVSRQGRAYWEAAGFEIVGYRRLGDVGSIFHETEERAYELARGVDVPNADA